MLYKHRSDSTTRKHRFTKKTKTLIREIDKLFCTYARNLKFEPSLKFNEKYAPQPDTVIIVGSTYIILRLFYFSFSATRFTSFFIHKRNTSTDTAYCAVSMYVLIFFNARVRIRFFFVSFYVRTEQTFEHYSIFSSTRWIFYFSREFQSRTYAESVLTRIFFIIYIV